MVSSGNRELSVLTILIDIPGMGNPKSVKVAPLGCSGWTRFKEEFKEDLSTV